MKVLVIPDVHLKPVLFVRAAELLEKGEALSEVFYYPHIFRKARCYAGYVLKMCG